MSRAPSTTRYAVHNAICMAIYMRPRLWPWLSLTTLTTMCLAVHYAIYMAIYMRPRLWPWLSLTTLTTMCLAVHYMAIYMAIYMRLSLTLLVGGKNVLTKNSYRTESHLFGLALTYPDCHRGLVELIIKNGNARDVVTSLIRSEVAYMHPVKISHGGGLPGSDKGQKL